MTTAIALFSGGLDSILSCRVIDQQGITVKAVKFISPFFDYHLLADEQRYQQRVREKFGIDVQLRDISQEYMDLLRAPAHGYGKHFNPCLDCKIFMVSKARALMEEMGASFLITGEVVGQRPMSQRKDTMRVVERDSGCCPRLPDQDRQGRKTGPSILLRPLCAKNMEPSQPEIDGLVDREQLLGFSGRNRKPQMALAKEFGISGYPTPAGGCILTDPLVGERIKTFYAEHQEIRISDMLLIQVGRQFRLPDGGWLVMGRKKGENEQVTALSESGDLRLKLKERPGPSALLRFAGSRQDLELAAGLVARYGKKGADGRIEAGNVQVLSDRGEEVVFGQPVDDEVARDWGW